MNGKGIHILLVEDNADHAELVRRELEHSPAVGRLDHVEDGEAALDYVFGRGRFTDRARFPAPDLVLLDLRIPRLDGLEVLRLIKSHPDWHQLPVVMLTSSDTQRDLAEAKEFHVDHFLTKPLAAAKLEQLLASLNLPPRRPEPPGSTETPTHPGHE